MRVFVGSFKYDGGDLKLSYQFRNDNDSVASFEYELRFTARGKSAREVGTLRLEPHAESNTSGYWVICSPSAGFTGQIILLRLERNVSSGQWHSALPGKVSAADTRADLENYKRARPMMLVLLHGRAGFHTNIK